MFLKSLKKVFGLSSIQINFRDYGVKAGNFQIIKDFEPNPSSKIEETKRAISVINASKGHKSIVEVNDDNEVTHRYGNTSHSSEVDGEKTTHLSEVDYSGKDVPQYAVLNKTILIKNPKSVKFVEVASQTKYLHQKGIKEKLDLALKTAKQLELDLVKTNNKD